MGTVAKMKIELRITLELLSKPQKAAFLLAIDDKKIKYLIHFGKISLRLQTNRITSIG